MIRTPLWMTLVLVSSITSLSASELVTNYEVYKTPEGQDFLAVKVTLSDTEMQTESDEKCVLLVDTSASQIGEHREQALAITRKLLENISPSTSVKVFAVDLTAEAITPDFTTINSQITKDVMAEFEDRIPAGSTDLASALEIAQSEFSPEESGTIVYIGDGLCSGHLITPEKLQALTSDLREQRIQVSSIALGGKTDLQLLGILALQTGGIVIQDQPQITADQLSQQLANSLSSPVVYPEDIQVRNESVALTLFPQSVLPVRTDRETIFLTNMGESSTQEIQVELTVNGQSHKTVCLQEEAKGHPALRALWLRAQRDAGISVPTAGNEILTAAKLMFDEQIAQMLGMANKFVANQQKNQTVQISQSILTLDPGNRAAVQLLAQATKALSTQRVAFQPGTDVPPAIIEELDDLEQNRTDAPTSTEQDIIQKFQNRSQIAGEKLKLQVSQAVEEARLITTDDPEAAISILKSTLGTVRSAADIDPEIRRDLDRQVGQVILEVRAKQEKLDNQRVRLQQQLAEQEARQRVIEEMTIEERRLEQLVDQVRSLIDDGYHGDSAAFAQAEEVAEAAVELAPDSGTANSARFVSEAAGQLDRARRLRLLRADRLLETLTQVELSHVPFPDEPPVRYPPAPVWKALTERRQIWASVDLKDDSPSERRIRAALEDETELQFVDTPLSDALDIIGELHNITIIPDELALEDAGIPTDEPVTLFISGIRLKSALRIMLEKLPEPLTWIIEDEVMKITTQIVAEEKLETRVYPVADLVIPIQVIGGGGGGALGGGVGLGQGGGFGGGQQGGFGGGGGGGGFGGGGFFSIPAEIPTKKNLN